MHMAARSPTRRESKARRAACLLGWLSAVAGCSYDWDLPWRGGPADSAADRACDGRDDGAGRLDAPAEWQTTDVYCQASVASAVCHDVRARFRSADHPIDPADLKIFGETVQVGEWREAFLAGDEDPDPPQAPLSCLGNSITRETAWFILRKRTSPAEWKIVIRGNSRENCPTSASNGFLPRSHGEVHLARGWKIASVDCRSPTTCNAPQGGVVIEWLNGFQCGVPAGAECCLCPDGARVDIEVHVTRE